MASWTIERVRALNDDDLLSLRKNAQERNGVENVVLCDQVMQERGITDSRAGKGRRRKTASEDAAKATLTSLDDAAVLRLADALIRINEDHRPLDRENVRGNIARREGRVATARGMTLDGLWWQWTVCAFSSNEPAGVGSAVYHFEHPALRNTPSPLHDLAAVARAGGTEAWAMEELRKFGDLCKDAGIPRFWLTAPKAGVVSRNYPLFERAGKPDDLLADCCKAGGELRLFCDLARGDVNDSILETSAAFSAGIDPEPFHGVKNKQVRNILLNSGLAVNVLPLDSRWGEFLEEEAQIAIDSKRLQDKTYYLAVEDLVRRALIEVLRRQPLIGIPNLSTLDAVVFEYFETKKTRPASS